MLLESADDLAVDILDAVEILALFIARAVVDDILLQHLSQGQKSHYPSRQKDFKFFKQLKRATSRPHIMLSW